MGNSKVIFGNETLIDLTGDTVTPDTLLAGTTAHNRSGEQIVGTATVPDALDDLTDVELTSPAEGDMLQRDGNGKWVNSAAVPNAVAAVRDNGAVNKLKCILSTQSIGGLTVTVNDDGTVHISEGTANANINLGYASDVELFAGHSYRLTGCPSGGSASSSYKLQYYRYSGYTGVMDDIGNGAQVTRDSYSKGAVFIIIVSGTVIPTGGITFKPMLSDPRLDLSYNDYQPYAMTNRELTERKVNLIGTNTWNFYNSPSYEEVNVTKTIPYDGWFIATVYCQGLANVNSNLTVLLNNSTVARVGQNARSSITMILPVILPVKAGDTLSLQCGAGSSCYVTSNVFY